MFRIVSLLLFFFMVASTAGFTQTAPKPVIVGSKIDTEGSLLGKIIVKALNANGIQAVDKTSFGTTDIVRKAIIAKQLDIYPEYTGNGGFFFAGTDANLWKNAKKAYDTVRKLDFDKNGLVWLTPAPANNTWALAIRDDVAQKEKLATLEDLARFVNAGGAVRIAGSEEFISRPDALPGFQGAYGFKLKPDQVLSLSGGNTALTEKAAALGTDGVNAAMAYGTDGALAALGLTVLTDPKGVQPVYQPAPLVRKDILKTFPAIEAILKPVFAALDLKTLQTLNSRIAVNGESADAVAVDFLKKKGFIK